jgi:hypothetical protein
MPSLKKLGSDFPGETFRVLKEKEEREYGEYRPRHLKIDGGDVFGIFRYSTEYYFLKIETR